jgi:mannose-6-phosphate isomerase-like protein (cupin superfamily)
MSHRNSGIAAIAATILTALLPAAAAEPPAAAPAPGSPGVYVGHAAVAAQLATAVAASKDPAVSPVAITDQYSINQVHRGKPAPPAIHPGWTELHIVLDGGATFITGGQIKASADGNRSVVEGGVSHRVEKGDAVIVPPNSPHWYQQVDTGGITVIEVRFIAPAAGNPGK